MGIFMEYVDYIDYREKVFGVGLDFSDLYFKKDGKKYLLMIMNL